MKSLDQQVIVITGASSGIGLATAELAAEQGARLVLAARSEEVLADIVAEINANGGEAIHVAADVCERQQVERIAQAALERGLGASIHGSTMPAFPSMAGWTRSAKPTAGACSRPISGASSTARWWLPHLRLHGGALINLGSEVSEAVIPLQGMYAASKHAVKGFTDSLRVEIEELDKAPVSITLIQPTAVNTPYPQHAKNYMDQEPKLPTPQIDPYHVARAILHAATDATRDIKVGMMSKLNTTMENVLPALAQKMEAKQAHRQQYDEAPRNPDGALYRPSNGGQVYGSGGVQH